MCFGTSQMGMPVPQSLNIDPVQKKLAKKNPKKQKETKVAGVSTGPDQLTLLGEEFASGLLS
jgi:hypothetical protein